MSWLGWVFMITSITFVLGLCAWCYAQVLGAVRGDEKGD